MTAALEELSATRRGVPGLRGLDHAAFTVPDLEQAVEFFCEHLGADLVFRDGPFAGAELPARLGVHRCAGCRLAMLRLGDTTNLELFQYEAPDQRTTMPLNSDVGGHHLAFYADDSPVAGQRWFSFRTPWGMQLEATSDGLGKFYEGLSGAGMVAPG